jgi:hypothetical protein
MVMAATTTADIDAIAAKVEVSVITDIAVVVRVDNWTVAGVAINHKRGRRHAESM